MTLTGNITKDKKTHNDKKNAIENQQLQICIHLRTENPQNEVNLEQNEEIRQFNSYNEMLTLLTQ